MGKNEKSDPKAAEAARKQAEAVAKWERQERQRREHEDSVDHSTKYDKRKQWGED